MKQKLSDLYAQRKQKADELETILNGATDKNAEERLNNGLAELEGMDWEIRKIGVRDRIDAGGIVPQSVMGLATTDARAEVRDFFAGGYKHGGKLELRATQVSTLGGATTVADPSFTQLMDRDAVVARLATVTSVNSGAPLRFYRQSSYMTALTTAIAEAGAFSDKDPAANVVDFAPTKLGVVTSVSNETLRDLPFDVASEVIREHAELHGANWELAFLAGTNGSSLTGTLNAYSGISSQSIWDFGATGNALNVDLTGASITVAEGATIAYSTGLRPQYLGNACWLLAASVWASILSQSQANSFPFGGGQLPSIARDGSGPMDGNRSTVNFMGFPVYLTASWPTTSTTGDPIGVFGNIERGYRIVRVDSVPMISDPYTSAANGQVRFLSETRMVGKILDRNAMVSIRR